MVEALGLGSILLWQWLTVLKGPLLVPSPGTFFEDPRVGYVYFSLVLCGTLLVLTRWGPSLRERGFRPLLWGCAGVMSLAWLPWGEALRALAPWGPFLQIGLPAVGSVVLLVSWEWRLTSAPFFLQSSVFGGACVLRTGLILLVSLALPSLLVPLAAVLPFLAALLWSPPGKASGSPPPSEGQPSSFPLRLALRAGVLLPPVRPVPLPPSGSTEPFHRAGRGVLRPPLHPGGPGGGFRPAVRAGIGPAADLPRGGDLPGPGVSGLRGPGGGASPGPPGAAAAGGGDLRGLRVHPDPVPGGTGGEGRGPFGGGHGAAGGVRGHVGGDGAHQGPGIPGPPMGDPPGADLQPPGDGTALLLQPLLPGRPGRLRGLRPEDPGTEDRSPLRRGAGGRTAPVGASPGGVRPPQGSDRPAVGGGGGRASGGDAGTLAGGGPDPTAAPEGGTLPAGDPGGPPGGPGPDQRGDRPAAQHHRQHPEDPPAEHPPQAGFLLPRGAARSALPPGRTDPPRFQATPQTRRGPSAPRRTECIRSSWRCGSSTP